MRKYPFPLNAIRSIFPILETLAPGFARSWAARLFVTPVRYGFTEKEQAFLPKLEQFEFEAAGRKVMGYRMGDGPEVVCVHGWAGRAMQFRVLAEALVEHGYSFVSFDAWGHGQSAGKQSDLFEFSAGFEALYGQCKDPIAVVGHSLGLAAVGWSVHQGFQIPALISLAAPVVAQDILDDFCKIINASPKAQEGVRKRAVEKYDIEFDDAVLEATFHSVQCPVLALHGERDQDAPVSHLDVLKSINANIDARKIPDLGHRGILKSPVSIGMVTEWLNGMKSSVQ